jgi:abortive infection bacteriophage resistance protein
MTIDTKKATTIDEQIALLKSRGMVIDDVKKAKENLFDIGYFRLGFYWFPFEATYPRKNNRTHQFTSGANFAWAIKLYYFDFDLRNILLRYISRIEVNFRTSVVYLTSNEYKDNPCWYVDPTIIKKEILESRNTTML